LAIIGRKGPARKPVLQRLRSKPSYRWPAEHEQREDAEGKQARSFMGLDIPATRRANRHQEQQ
jgi:hypothetical protein